MSDPRNVRTSPASGVMGEAGCLPAGYRLHEFVIESVLGEGGFGVVYAAMDTRLERRVAIKEYMPASLATRNADFSVHARSSADHQEAFVAGLRSFVNEAKLLARFEHPSLVKVYQFWEERGTAYMVMPLYTAPTFKRWIRQRTGPVEEQWLVAFLDGLIDALDVLHKENCLHRDVAPDNILVLNDESPLLLDFGAARRVIGDLTHNLTVILKPGFAPVEQYAESSALKQGPWTDVYALSAVGYFAITGKAPVAAVGRMVSDELVPLRQFAAGRYSPRLLSALDAGLRVKPEERPLSMQALRAYLTGGIVPDERTTVVSERPLAPPLGPVPNALQSTFKPAESATRVDASTRFDPDATRSMGHAAAPPGPTIAPSGAPTYKLPAPAPAKAPTSPQAKTPAPARPGKKSNTLLLAGSLAACGAAVVWAAVWLLSPPRASVADTPVPVSPPAPAASPAPAPLAEAKVEPPAPVVAVTTPAVQPSLPPAAATPALPTPASPPPARPAAPLPLPKAEPAPSKLVATTPQRPADIPAKPVPVPAVTKTTEVPPAAPVPSPAPAPATTKPEPEPAKAEKPVDGAKGVDAPKPAPAPAAEMRAPDGPPPLTVSDKGIVDLQADLDPKVKEPRFTAYTCCNLHADGDWVSDLNYSGETRIPAGAPIKIVDYGRWRLITEIDGKKVRIGLDYGRRQETLAQFARKLTVDKDLRFRIAAFPAVVQDAIRAAKVMPGMTREQVVIAVGFPARHETASVAVNEWKLWHTSRVPYTVRFDERGRVKAIDVEAESRHKVVFGVKPPQQ